MMKCTLMHRKIPVAELEVDEATGVIQKIKGVHAVEHLPVGVMMRKDVPDRGALNEWWMDRAIPMSRSGIREALSEMGISDTGILLLRCLGLSLSDQYWIRPEGSDMAWEKINFFENPFSEDVGAVLFGEARRNDALNLSSPDNTSDGNLKKRWRIIDGKRALVKGGSSPYRQQPFNEVIASRIMDRLDIPHVEYTMTWDHDAPYSLCEDFITADTELVPAWRIIQTRKKQNNQSMYRHFVNCAVGLGIPDVISSLDRMIALDYLIANEDRHLNNFGAIRNAETLEWMGMAPIYDSGSSLGYDSVTAFIRRDRDVPCKPFKRQHEEQLRLVRDFSWIDFFRLRDVHDEIVDIFSVPEAEEYLEEPRIRAIADSVDRRIQKLKKIAEGQKASFAELAESTADDVIENIAKAYD